MAGITAEDRAAMREGVRRLLADRSTPVDVRRTMALEAGYDPDLWRALADMGVTGLLAPAEHGGLGAGPMELEAVMEEAGAALFCGPLMASAVVATGLLQALGDADVNQRLLPRMVEGRCIATAALTGPGGCWTEAGVAVTAAEAGGGEARLNGVATYVPYGQIANVLLVAAREEGGVGVYEVDPVAPGVAVTALPAFDLTQRLAEVTLLDVGARRIGAAANGWGAVETALDLARVALAGEQAGAGRRVLAFTVDYAKTRIQFGRPIGGFQAIKHMAADLLLESESAISAARNAAERLATGGVKEARAAVDLAAFVCADAFCAIAAASIQMHGGVAFTWEHPAHLYLRRARADAQLYGAPAVYRERYLQAMGG